VPLSRGSVMGVALFERCQRDVPTFREIKGSVCAAGRRAIQKINRRSFAEAFCICGTYSNSWCYAMKLRRRTFLQLAVGAATLPALSRTAKADTYPARPVRIIVGLPAGSSTDIHARLIGQWLSDRLGQPFVVDNRPGATGNIGTEAVVKALPDGYTLLWCNSSNAINETLYDNLKFIFTRDIAPVASIVQVPLVMEVNLSVPAMTVHEFIAYAKAHPGEISMASSGNGSVQHVAGELFKMMTGVAMLHVPYRGSPQALTDLLAGQVQVMFDVAPTALPQIRAGKLRALAVTTTKHIDVLPDVPPMAEFVPGYEALGWIGAGVPTGTPSAIIETLNKEINAGLADDKIKSRLADLGGIVMTGSPVEFRKFVVDETEKWAKVIKFAGIKPE